MVLCDGFRETAADFCLGADVMIESDFGGLRGLVFSMVRASGGRNVGGSAAGPQAFCSMRMTSLRATALPSAGAR